MEDDGILSPLNHQISIYEETDKSQRRIMNNVSAENTLEPPITVEDKHDPTDKIDSLGVAAEDYRGLLMMQLRVNDKISG